MRSDKCGPAAECVEGPCTKAIALFYFTAARTECDGTGQMPKPLRLEGHRRRGPSAGELRQRFHHANGLTGSLSGKYTQPACTTEAVAR